MANSLKHKFTSPKADGPDTALIRPSNWNEEHVFAGGLPDQVLQWDDVQTDKVRWGYPTRMFETLTNTAGAATAIGDVMVLDSLSDQSATTTTTLQDPRPVRVAAAIINSGSAGRFEAIGRVAILNVQGAVTRGDYLATSTTAKRAASVGSSPVDGAFGYAITGFAGPGAGTVIAVLFGTTLQVRPVGLAGVRGLRVVWNTSTLVDITAHSIAFRDVNNRVYTAHNYSKQASISTTGLGGRDQTGSFGNDVFVHLYAITKADGTTSAVWSIQAPPTGPDLATLGALAGYIGWTYVSTWRIGPAGTLLQGIQTGPHFRYEGTLTQVLTGGTATTETLVSASSAVPSIALEMELLISAFANAAGQLTALTLSSLTGAAMTHFETQAVAPGTIHGTERLPNRSQQFYYQRQTALATDIWVAGYVLPIND